jgi:hypothetical protein
MTRPTKNKPWRRNHFSDCYDSVYIYCRKQQPLRQHQNSPFQQKKEVMAPLLPPTRTQYNIVLQRANSLKEISDDAELCARLIMDKSDIDYFKELAYVLVREHKVCEGVVGKLSEQREEWIKDGEKKDKKIAGLEAHVKDLSQQVLKMTTSQK